MLTLNVNFQIKNVVVQTFNGYFIDIINLPNLPSRVKLE